MPAEHQAEMFIRLLADALEADRLVERAILTLQHRQNAKRRQLCRSDLNHALASIEPLDCVQMMATKIQGRRFR